MWLFVGSDDHGQAAGNLLTLIASARLHKLDPEGYLRDIFRVLPHWPRDRYLELAPRYWRITRARLRRDELEREVGWLTIPEPPLPTMMPTAAALTTSKAHRSEAVRVIDVAPGNMPKQSRSRAMRSRPRSFIAPLDTRSRARDP